MNLRAARGNLGLVPLVGLFSPILERRRFPVVSILKRIAKLILSWIQDRL